MKSKLLNKIYDDFMSGTRIIKKYHHDFDDEVIIAADAEITHLEKIEETKDEREHLVFYVHNDVNWGKCCCKENLTNVRESIERCKEDELSVCDLIFGGKLFEDSEELKNLFIMESLIEKYKEK